MARITSHYRRMHAAKLISSYEEWCDRAIPSDAAARREKHTRMAASAFAFLRGSYPVWLDRFGADAAHDAPPVPLSVGDLHVENFGTWLAPAGEAFGVNDYDETGAAPFTNDLVRLATSAVLAVRAGHLGLDPKDIAKHLWAGYSASTAGAAGVALGDESIPHVAAVAAMWNAAQPEAAGFWKRIDALPEAPPGESPDPAPGFVLQARRIRTAGLGSRDHLRLVLEGELGGERAAFERKPLAPTAASYLAGAEPKPDPRPYAALLERQHERSPQLQAQVRVEGATIVRRLDSHRGRIEIADLPDRRDEHALLWMMGYCTAAHHGLSADTGAFAQALDAGALEHASRRMADVVSEDHADFCKHLSSAGNLHA
jgi:Uncharacterized protein conserved in bacteria (DUF2252)